MVERTEAVRIAEVLGKQQRRDGTVVGVPSLAVGHKVGRLELDEE